MRVTAIKQQVKNKDRYSVYVDDVYVFSLSQNGILQAGIAVGDELTQQDVDSYKERSNQDKLYERLLNYLSIRPRSQWELQSYMARKKVDPDLQKHMLEVLQTKGYIDDASFARAWVESRRLLKPVSQRKLWQELKVKRVPEHIIETVLAEDTTDEQAILRELIQKKQQQQKYQDSEKLMQYLARQGFSYGDIKSALEEN